MWLSNLSSYVSPPPSKPPCRHQLKPPLQLASPRALQGKEHRRIVFHGVHESVKYGAVDQAWSKTEENLNYIVFIGRNLNRKAIAEGFRSTVWVPLPDGWSEHFDGATKRPFYYHRASKTK